jgi:hypothetical protein
MRVYHASTQFHIQYFPTDVGVFEGGVTAAGTDDLDKLAADGAVEVSPLARLLRARFPSTLTDTLVALHGKISVKFAMQVHTEEARALRLLRFPLAGQRFVLHLTLVGIVKRSRAVRAAAGRGAVTFCGWDSFPFMLCPKRAFAR